MFLAAGCPAKKYHMEALRRWEIPFLWTDGVEVEDVPVLESATEVDEFTAPVEDIAAPEPKISVQASPSPSPAAAASENVDVSSFDSPKEAESDEYVRPKAVSYAAPRKPKVDRSGEEEVNIEDFIENFDEL